jgi:uncharacterized damage-inducible protein DinB
MKELLVQFASYNLWANTVLMHNILSLPEEQQQQEMASSFKSLYKTTLHIWDAENMWWQRMKLLEHILRPSDAFKGSFHDLVKELQLQDKQWIEWINNAQEHHLQHEFSYQNTKREKFKQPVFQMLLHLFNHGSYHRGQLVNILRQLEVDKIPQTDFIVWSRKKGNV